MTVVGEGSLAWTCHVGVPSSLAVLSSHRLSTKQQMLRQAVAQLSLYICIYRDHLTNCLNNYVKILFEAYHTESSSPLYIVFTTNCMLECPKIKMYGMLSIITS